MADKANRASWGDLLAAEVRAKASPLVVGIDPRLSSLPPQLRAQGEAGLEAAGEAFATFGKAVIDAVAEHTAVVKPQAAFFEQLGVPGMIALQQVITHARSAELLVLLDGKRNDIGSTAAGYADAYLGQQSAWGADALTVSPYLGSDSLTPFADVCEERGAGMFVLVKTSNPGGGEFQDLSTGDENGPRLYERVAMLVESLAERSAGASGYGAVGAVVGATYPEQLSELRSQMPHAWLLIPGFGAQGGSAADTAGGFHANGLGAIVNSSRGVIFAYDRPEYAGAANWQDAVAAAARDAKLQLLAETPAGTLSG
ncbi:MAG: orotidine-5'-phosphate decarboxylase [Planctomycetales bacterium]|nr:orotidine-5'-phosphate decarboxylase [Planctomycetales bacterium]